MMKGVKVKMLQSLLEKPLEICIICWDSLSHHSKDIISMLKILWQRTHCRVFSSLEDSADASAVRNVDQVDPFFLSVHP